MQVLYAVYGGIQVALVALWAGPSTITTRASVANAVVSLVAACALGILSFIEHQRTIRPSFILETFLLLTLFFDIAHSRTLWLSHYQPTIAAVTSVSTGIKLGLMVVEAISKRSVLRKGSQGTSTEATSGFYARTFFWWLNPLFRKGWSKSLAVEELFPLDKHLTTSFLYDAVKGPWDNLSSKGPRSLLYLFFRRFKWYFLCVVPPRLGYIGFTFSQPFLISEAIALVDQPINKSTDNAAYGMIGAYIIVYMGIAITMAQFQHWTYRSITMARGGLISMLFNKTTLVKPNDVDPSSSLTLMSADIERITTGWQHMHEIWANSLEVALAIYLLERQLGAACAIPLSVAVGMFMKYIEPIVFG